MGDYHSAMAGQMFSDWIKVRLTAAFKEMFGEDKQNGLNASPGQRIPTYQHTTAETMKEEVKLPKPNNKIQAYSCRSRVWSASEWSR